MNMFSKIFEHKYYHLIMLLSIFSYVLLSISYPKIGDISRAIFLIGSIGIFFIHRERIFKDPMFLMLTLAISSAIFSWINSKTYIPDQAKSIPEIDKLARLFIFIPIAYWLKGRPKLIVATLVLFAFGFILGMITKSDFYPTLISGINGTRVDFDIKNAQYTSMFSGFFSILSAFCIYFIYMQKKPINYKGGNITLLILLTISLFFFLTITIISQSRMVFLGFIMIMFLFPILHKKSNNDISTLKIVTSYVFLLFIILSFICLFWPNIEKRFNHGDFSTVLSVIKFNFDNIPMSSAGIRINSWIEGLRSLIEHPILGLGSRGSAFVIINSEMFTDRINENYTIITGLRHLHSFHMDTLVCYGIFGFLVLNGAYFVMLRSLIRIRSVIPNANYWIMLAICIVVYWLTINGFESFNFRTYGVLTHNVFMAAFYTFALTHHLFPTHTDETNNENRGSCQQS